MGKIKKFLCMLLVCTMVIAPCSLIANVFAQTEVNEPLTIDVSTDKSSYGTCGVAEITVKVTNTSNETVNNISAEAIFEQLAPVGKSNETFKEVDSLQPGESFSFSYKATLNADKVNLNFLEKIILWLVRLFKGGFIATSNKLNNDRDFISKTNVINFGKYSAINEIKIWFDGIMSTPYDYLELISGVNIDEMYNYDDNDISVDEQSGIEFINNIIIIMFNDECTEKRKAEIIKSINGKVVGGDILYNELYIKIEKSTLEELENICEELNKQQDIFDASFEELYLSVNYMPNDPFYNGEDNGKVSWSVSPSNLNTSYNNWWALATDLQGAWGCDNFYSNINIGVADVGFSNSHQDLNIQVVSKENSPDNHGTHVAGLIGATHNDMGIAGVVNKCNLYGYDLEKSNKGFSETEAFKALKELVTKHNCKVINYSIGNKIYEKNGNYYFNERCTKEINNSKIKNWGYKSSKKISSLLEKGYDFVVIQSAGNGTVNKGLGIDSVYNGTFCSITKGNCYSSKKISADEILNRVIIVANANKNINSGTTFEVYRSSNGGSNVDISAPGTNIYSTVAGIEEKESNITIIASGQQYGWLTGTSMAAPIVSGIAGLVWSVNPGFSGAEVKEIVCNSYEKNTLVKDNPNSPTTGDLRLVNAKLAVEKAIEQTYFSGGDGTIENPYQVSTPEQLNAVRYFLDRNFIQTADIDMSNWGNWEPIGKVMPMRSIAGNAPNVEEYYFTGTYNGKGYSIKNLKIFDNEVSPEYDCFGLFSGINNATISNLSIVNIEMDINKSSTNYEQIWLDQKIIYSVVVGGVCGKCLGDNTKVLNCNVSGKIDVTSCNNAFIGGIVGFGNPQNCTSNVELLVCADSDSRFNTDSTVCCGGITGQTMSVNGTVDKCANYGIINATAGAFLYLGGISGKYGYITDCINTGNISGNILRAGSSSTSFGQCNVGGIVGATNSDIVQCCINYGSISAKCQNNTRSSSGIYAGGICGYNGGYERGHIYSCYNIGNSIVAKDDYNSNYEFAGRISGTSVIKTTNCYSSNKTLVNGVIVSSSEHTINGFAKNIEGADLSDEDFLKEETYIDFDFENTWKIDPNLGGAVLR